MTNLHCSQRHLYVLLSNPCPCHQKPGESRLMMAKSTGCMRTRRQPPPHSNSQQWYVTLNYSFCSRGFYTLPMLAAVSMFIAPPLPLQFIHLLIHLLYYFLLNKPFYFQLLSSIYFNFLPVSKHLSCTEHSRSANCVPMRSPGIQKILISVNMILRTSWVSYMWD